MINFEQSILNEGYRFIVGVDEAGRGPLAGPVVAAAVAVKDYDFSSRIADSKKMTPRQRQLAFVEIYDKAYVGVGIINEVVIDRDNILEATYMAMTNAIHQVVASLPEAMNSQAVLQSQMCLLIDGNRFKSDLPYPYRTVIKGDSKAFSIACASIVAKVIRDRILLTYDKIFPEYGFKQHKGYPTAKHKEAIRNHGPSLIHRQTFIHL